MSESQQATEKALQKLSNQLTCSVCHETYQDPKVLPCLHVFCTTCLESLVSRDKTSLNCPKCQHTKRLPQGGVSSLQSPFSINHLFDMQDTLKKVQDETLNCQHCGENKAMRYCGNCSEFYCQSCTEAHKEWTGFASHEVTTVEAVQAEAVSLVPFKKEQITCSKHPGKPTEVYCETCEELICNCCMVKTHRHCSYSLISDCFPKYRDAITASLQPVKQQLDTVNQALAEVDARSSRLAEQTQSTKESIQQHVDQLHEILEARKLELIANVKQLTKQSEESFQAQREGYEKFQKQYSSCLEFVNESLRTGSEEEILSIRPQVMDQLQQMVTEFDSQMFQPKPELILRFSHKQLAETCRSVGKVFLISSVCPEISGATANEQDQESPALGTTANTLDRPPSGTTANTLDRPPSGTTANTLGRPSPTLGRPSPTPTHKEFQGTHVKTLTGLKEPRELIVTANGEVVVAEKHADRITVLNGDGRKLRSFGNTGTGMLSCPRGVALCNSNHVLVAAQHCVRKFTLQGTRVASVGVEGIGRLQFSSPWAIAVNPSNEKIYVCDTGNNRIQVLNSDLTFSNQFGSKGNGEGELSCPTSIAIDSKGSIFVADFFNNRVQVFTSTGEFTREIKQRGPGMEQMESPVSLCVDSNDMLYVFESNAYCISMFNSDGQFLKSFGRRGSKPGEFICPYGIAVDASGYVYVSDTHNHNIQIFK